jgi:maltokinase
MAASEALLARLDEDVRPEPSTPPAFALVPIHPCRAKGERAVSVDQTHESVVVGDRAVVKWAVYLAPSLGRLPAVRAAQHLDAVGFTETPEPVGFLVWRDHGPGPLRQALVASATTFLPGARDGWDWAVDDVLDHLAGRTDLSTALAPATALGALVARLHLAFATPSTFEPEPEAQVTDADAGRWQQTALGVLDRALALTTGEPGERLASRADGARAVLEGVGSLTGSPMTMVHGDLHVGQVLRWDEGYAVVDFDGNPVLPTAERAALQPPARDVAGMLRSLDHVGRVADRRTDGAHAEQTARWTAAAREAFLDAYRGSLAGAGRPDLLDERMLLPFEVEQECREFVYAALHLQRWVYVPDAAFAALMDPAAEAGRP